MATELRPSDRNSTTQAFFKAGRDPELERLLWFRVGASAVMWLLAIGWSRLAPVNIALVTAATLGTLLATVAAMFVLRKRPAESPRIAELHVAADLAIMPAFTLATGGWASPFAAMLVAKGVASALLVGRTRAMVYGTATVVMSMIAWAVADLLSAPAGAAISTTIAPPLVVGGILAVLGGSLLQAVSLPMEAYRNRRKQLVTENRRLEEAIGELEVQNQRLSALHELSGAIGTLGSIDEVVGRLREAVQTTFPGRMPSFFIYRREAGKLEPVSLAHGADRTRAEALCGPDGDFFRALGGSVSGDSAPRMRDGVEKLDPHAISQVVVPLQVGGKPVGLLALETRSAYPFDEDDRQLLATMGNEMAVALRNAELNTRSKQLWEFQQSLIENANALILVVDAAGTVEIANKALVSLLELENHPVGRPVASLLAARSVAVLEDALATAMEGTAVENLRLDLRHGRSGERRAVFNLAAVRDRAAARSRDGETTPSGPQPLERHRYRHVVAVGQDITRTELLEREILHSEKLASLGTFVAGIAHEMNNPLTAITAYGDYLRRGAKKGELPVDVTDKLDNIVLAGERIQGFVQSLLGFARPVSGVRPDLDLNGVIRDSVRLCQYDLGKVQVEVEVDLAAELPPVAGIEAELQQVFINLFTNAAHAAPKDGAKLRIASTRDENGVRVTVSDNGHGIPPEVLPRIFDTFYSTKAEGKGSGLGLSIVKRIIDQHDGRIAVESAVGKGTTFSIEIPHATPRRESIADGDGEPESRAKAGASGS